jgi:hypothetical protein
MNVSGIMIEIIFDSKSENCHGDITLNLFSSKFIRHVDSYYLALDNFFMPDDESEEKVIFSLQNMIASWSSLVDSANINDLLYLSYDFSDQYIGFLKIYIVSLTEITISVGHSTTYQGCTTNPSRAASLRLLESEFKSTTEDVVVDRRSFVFALKQALKVI